MELKKKYYIIPIWILILSSIFAIGYNVGKNYRYTNLNMGLVLNPPPNNEVLGVHTDAWLTRAITGEIIYLGHHAGVMTNIGYDNVQDALFDSGTTGYDAYYMSLSANATATPLSSWTIIPNEINSGGLSRASGVYSRTSATVLTLSYQWTASSSHTGVRIVGYNWQSSGDNNLMWADTFASTDLGIGDKLTVIGTITLSQP